TVVNEGPKTIPGFTNEPKDLDNDGLYEDVNGDGTVNIVDVQAMFAHLGSNVIQNNPSAFDYNNDGDVDIVDVQKLFTMV
ncbi:MAG: dockerin type I domain-containing protein, partial [Halobacteriaceae archaeon]